MNPTISRAPLTLQPLATMTATLALLANSRLPARNLLRPLRATDLPNDATMGLAPLSVQSLVLRSLSLDVPIYETVFYIDLLLYLFISLRSPRIVLALISPWVDCFPLLRLVCLQYASKSFPSVYNLTHVCFYILNSIAMPHYSVPNSSGSARKIHVEPKSLLEPSW